MTVKLSLTIPQAEMLESAARSSGDWAGPFEEFFWDKTNRYNPSLRWAYETAMRKLRQALEETNRS